MLCFRITKCFSMKSCNVVSQLRIFGFNLSRFFFRLDQFLLRNDTFIDFPRVRSISITANMGNCSQKLFQSFFSTTTNFIPQQLFGISINSQPHPDFSLFFCTKCHISSISITRHSLIADGLSS